MIYHFVVCLTTGP